MIISAGLGTSIAPVRFMRPPEIVLVELGGAGENQRSEPTSDDRSSRLRKIFIAACTRIDAAKRAISRKIALKPQMCSGACAASSPFSSWRMISGTWAKVKTKIRITVPGNLNSTQ